MTLLASRKKLITFRVTAEEYEALKNVCISKRSRSISELTRGAVLQQLAADSSFTKFYFGDLVALISDLEQIDEALRDLSGRISKLLGPAAKHSNDNAAS
jgi:hypothetical protein